MKSWKRFTCNLKRKYNFFQEKKIRKSFHRSSSPRDIWWKSLKLWYKLSIKNWLENFHFLKHIQPDIAESEDSFSDNQKYFRKLLPINQSEDFYRWRKTNKESAEELLRVSVLSVMVLLYSSDFPYPDGEIANLRLEKDLPVYRYFYLKLKVFGTLLNLFRMKPS